MARYWFFAKDDRPNGMYWETIAAEDGDPEAMVTLAQRQMLEGRRESDMRARFWLNRARAAGNARARTVLQELDARLKEVAR